MKICYIFPSRSRPEKFFKTLDNITSNSAKENYEIIAVLDLDDTTMNNDVVKDRLKSYLKVNAFFGLSTGKVDAINRELKNMPEDTSIVVLMSDDMVFTQWGFDDIIRMDMLKFFPDTDGALHYPCGTPVQNDIITLLIIGIAYFKRFNYLYHPEYTSLWCDYEQTVVAKKLGKYKNFPHTHIFTHLHPVWNKGEKYDNLMTRNESFYNSDKKIYFKRLEKNFDL